MDRLNFRGRTSEKKIKSKLSTKNFDGLPTNQYEKTQTHFKYRQINVYNPYNPINLLKDFKPNNVNNKRQIQIGKNIKLQLFPYSQQYYVVNLKYYSLPIKIVIKNLRAHFLLYISYDRQYSKVIKQENKIILTQKQSKHLKLQEKLVEQQKIQKPYDQMYLINSQIQIVLKEKKDKEVQNIYIAIVAQNQLTIFTFKIQSIFKQLKIQKKQERSKTQVSAKMLPSLNKKLIAIKEPSNLQKLSKYNILKNYIQSSNDKKLKSQQIVSDKEIKDNLKPYEHNKHIKTNLTSFSNYEQLYEEKNQRNNNNRLFENTSKKKQAVLQAIIKERKMKKIVSQLKYLIRDYQEFKKNFEIKEEKFVKFFVSTLYIFKFLSALKQTENTHKKRKSKIEKISYFVTKFAQILKNMRDKLILKIPSKKKRLLMPVFDNIHLVAQMQYKTVLENSQSIVVKMFKQLTPLLTINETLNKATIYLRSLVIIQKSWLKKFHARSYMLQMFAHNQVEIMMGMFPHFRTLQKQYQSSKVWKKICYEYMVNESISFRHVHQIYQSKIAEIQQYIKNNEKINNLNLQNPGNSKMRARQFFQVPQKPKKPNYRFFRNISILRSMLREWFELKYKQWVKKNIGI